MFCTSCGLPTSTQDSGSAREKATAISRRREQNRRAQRRFREKHRQQKALPEQDQSNAQNQNSPDAQDDGSPRTSGALTPPLSTMGVIDRPSSSSRDEERRPSQVIDWGLFLDTKDTGFGIDKGGGEDFWASSLKDTASVGDGATLVALPDLDECRGHRHQHHTMSSFSEPADWTESSKTPAGLTVLHRAVQTGNGKVVRLLLEHGADSSSKDQLGLTPLLYAVVSGHEEILELLLAHGAGAIVGHVDNAHGSALHWAVMHNRPRILKRLLSCCVGDREILNRKNKDSETPLSVAVGTGNEVAVKLLLDSGATINLD